MRKYVLAIVAFFLVVLACEVTPTRVFDSITGTGTTGISGTAETTSGEGTDSGTGGGTGISWDVGISGGTDIPPPKMDLFVTPDAMIDEEKCKRIDFLFVIDDSGSMSDEQINMISSFPGFISGIKNVIPILEEFHLGVTTTSWPIGNPPACQKQGALVTSTIGAGADSSESICGPYADGFSYMTSSDNLDIMFPCAAKVGTSGNSIAEQPIQSAMEALDAFMLASGQCNEGFLQEDSLLVLVMITDEDDQSGGVLQHWYDKLVWLKGSQDDIVVLSLVQTEYCAMVGYWSGVSYDLMEFTNMFTHGFIGDVCAPNYDTFFNQALGVIQTACIPPVE